MAKGIWWAIVVVGMLIAVSAGALSKFDVVPPRGGAIVHCDAPFYGSGHSLKGDEAKACDDEARTRAETGGVVAVGIGIGGLVIGRLFFRTRS